MKSATKGRVCSMATLSALILVFVASLIFAALSFGQAVTQEPRTFAQIQTEFNQWANVFKKAGENYEIGMQIIERARQKEQKAMGKMEELTAEAKTIQAPKPAAVVEPTEEAPVK